MNFTGKLYLFFAFLLAGSGVVSARFVTGKLGTFTITAVSMFFALAFLVPLCARQLKEYLRKMNLRNFLLQALQAFCGIFLFRLFLLTGLRATSAGEAGILTGATPAITAMLALIVLKEGFSFRKLSGVVATFAGILIIQGVLTPGNSLSLEHIGGNALVLCAAACESIFNTLSRSFAVKTAGEEAPSNPIVQTTVVSGIALLLCLIPAAFEHPIRAISEIGFSSWLALIWYGVFVTALAFICWYAGIKRCGALTAAAFSGMMPLSAMLLSSLILREQTGYIQWIGGFFVIVGMVLIGGNREERSSSAILQKNESSRS